MKTTVSTAHAKAHFADCLRATEQGRAVMITRHGKAVAALVPADEAEQLQRLRVAGPRAGLAGLSGGWDGSDELIRRVTQSRRTRPRRAPRFRTR